MSTVKEQTEESIKNQLILNVKDLIRVMNSKSDLNIAIVEEKTSGTSFEFSLEYPPYENSPQKFQPHVSELEAEIFIKNVLGNIEDLMGIKYREDNNFIKAFVPSDNKQGQLYDVPVLSTTYSKLYLHKKIHIRIHFVESDGPLILNQTVNLQKYRKIASLLLMTKSFSIKV